ncbi:Predicted arabinose efflux permease, MFS family [Paramicrobacterium humi]|uniref:Predicted arabinose efflux permease, MFS family n=1 Tax=Paramicrobacterium humi TaxID=640635 RepID=A0A1H4NZG1_9MICO|nr:MFS transporter [Microbacterium humi]SEC00539.1 Predicted arabinose efflux permease, MFS family [Microbacterium humi]
MTTYSALLRIPGVARLISAQLVARFPGGMLSLAFLIFVENRTGRYADAGLMLAATSIGQAVAGPLTSRWMGKWGMRRVLSLTLAICTLSVLSIALVPMTLPFYMVLGLLCGLSTPPIQPAVRTIYPKLVNSTQLTPLFSLDASAQEIIWVLGPVVTTFVSTQIGPMWGILLAATLMVGGGAWFIASPEVGRVRIPPSRRKLGSVLKKPTVLIATMTGFLLVGACAAVEAGVVATFGDEGLEAGVVLAIFSLGSLVGGLALGHVPISPWSLARRMFLVAFGMAAATAMLGVWWLAVTLFLAGAGIAPALAVLFAIVSSSVKFSDTAEAYGWIGTGQLIGAAIGSAIAGFLIDTNGPAGALWVAAGFAFAGFVLPALTRPWLPDLRGRDASPIPDTEPVQLQGPG